MNMKRMVLFIALTAFFSLASLSACGDQKKAEQSETKVTSADVKKEAKEVMETAKIYTQQQKEEYMKQIAIKIEEFDKERHALEAKAQRKANELKEGTEVKFNQSMEDLTRKKQAAADELRKLKTASGKAWDDLKAGMDSAMDDLNQAFNRARSHFEEGESKSE
jgi:hypothetical protein